MLRVFYRTGRKFTRRTAILSAIFVCILFIYLALPSRRNPKVSTSINTYPNHGIKFWKKPPNVDTVITRYRKVKPTIYKQILLWTPFFGASNWIRTEQFRGCRVQNCIVTEDKNLTVVSDAVIMHERDLSGRKSLPPLTNRNLHQRWIWLSQETYINFETNVWEYNEVFNWTMTYRLDSDIPIPYGAFRKRQRPLHREELQAQLNPLREVRKKLVAIRISHCNSTYTDRMAYVRKLQELIPVDVLGACGIPCNRSNDCENSYMRQYKFYLAFENCHCQEYITEKFWLPLWAWENVPVVMGGSGLDDYVKIAPPKSYIHVDQFESPARLAEYLLLLDQNPRLYNGYFQWRRNYEYHLNWYCTLCSALHDVSLPTKWYTNLTAWYSHDRCPTTHPMYINGTDQLGNTNNKT